MTMDERPHQLQRALRRYAVVVVVLAVLGGVAAAAYAAQRPHFYASSARILITPSVGNPLSPSTGSSGQQVTIAMTTEAALVDSDPVLALANAKLSPDISTTDVAVKVPPNTQIVLVSAKTSSATRSQQAAQALADAYLAYRKKITDSTREASLAQLNKRITGVKADLTTVSKKATGTTYDPETSRQIQVLTEQLISLQDSLSTAESVSSDPGTLVAPAEAGVEQGANDKLLTAGGAVAGLLVGLALAVWLGRRDKRVDARTSSLVSGVPVLAVFSDRRRADSVKVDVQAYQRLRTSILASTTLPSAVAVSGVGPRDTSSPIAVELGRSMTRAGYRVALVMAGVDETGPFADEARGARGLAEALRGSHDVVPLLVEHDGLMVLPSGSGIVEQQELLSGERFAHVVTDLKASFDYVLVVTGPLSLPAELATARLADVVLLVGRDGMTSRVDVGDIAARAHLVGLRVVGLALRSRRDPAVSRRGGGGPAAKDAPSAGPTTIAKTPVVAASSRSFSHTSRGAEGDGRRQGRTAREGT
jgi:succinoglycan biosynthesis transport protein ExoP